MSTFTLEKLDFKYAEDIVHHANNINVAAFLRDGFHNPYTLSDAMEYIQNCVEYDESRQICRAIAVEGKVVGTVAVYLDTDVYRKTAEVGYWLGEEYWGHGIMTTAVRAICDYAFDCYDLVRIHAETYVSNIGSRRVLEKAGFELEGIMRKNIYKFGQVIDSCIYARVVE